METENKQPSDIPETTTEAAQPGNTPETTTEAAQPNDTPKTTYADIAPKAQREIMTHAVLSGLTPLIPLPFVDDWARNGIQTRMVRAIARAHDKQLYESDIKALGKETGRDQSLLFATAKKLAFFPIKKIFRTALFVLVVKDIVDFASRTYHVGYLVDYALGLGRQNDSNSEAIRVAIDSICREADTSPVRRAFTSVFEQSRDVLGVAVNSVREWVGTPARDAGSEPKEVEAIADHLQHAVNILPPEHFVALRKALDTALGAQPPSP